MAQWRPQTRGLFGCGGLELRPFSHPHLFRRRPRKGSSELRWIRGCQRHRRGGWVRCRGGDSCGPTGVSTRCARPPHALRPCRVTRRPSLRSESSYGPCGPGWTGASRPSRASRRMRDEQSTGGLGRARSRGAVEAANAGAFGLRRPRTTAIPHPHLFQETPFIFATFASGSCGDCHSLFDVFLFFRDRSKRARSARVGVSTPDASANRRRNAS